MFTFDRSKIILDEIKNNLNKKNSEIAIIIEKKYPKEFANWKTDSIRRRISKIRIRENLNNNIKNDFNINLEKTENYIESGNTAISEKITSEKVKSLDDLIRVCNIDTKIWKIDKYEVTVYESHTKLRKFANIKEEHTRIDDEHKVVPLFRVRAFLSRKVKELQMQFFKDELIAEMKKYSPKYPKIKYEINKKEKGYLLEVALMDLHYGLMVWGQESGYDYDIKIASELFINAINKIIVQSKGYNIKEILFTVGNDFFNVDTIGNTTTAGTPQDEDTRWKKTYKKGRELLIEGINLLSQVAPVNVLVIPGNHDSQRSFFVGDALECWFNNSKQVNINNSPKVRKYYQFGKCMILLTHGRDEKMSDYPLLMASEEPEMWAKTKFREVHLGEIHHKKEVNFLSTEEYKGVTVRYMRSLSAPSNWAYTKGFVSSLRAGEAFIWSEDNGLIAQFTASI